MKDKIKNLFEKKNVESASRYFLQNLKGDYYYFEWMSSEYALKLVRSVPSYKTKVIRLYESQPQFDIKQLKTPGKIKSLNFVRKLSPGKNLKARLISVQGQPHAVLFCETMEDLFVDCFEHHCELLFYKKQCLNSSNYDSFLKTLYGEISRARRLKHPVSLVLIRSLCGNQEKSDSHKELFFKSLSRHLHKNNRMYDVLNQISTDEIACILPHTSEKGAVEKAQKIHWVLKAMGQKNILNFDFKFQVTVATYPTVGRDAVSLLNIARQVGASGDGQDVCVAQIPVAFRPDFLVPYMDEKSLNELT